MSKVRKQKPKTTSTFGDDSPKTTSTFGDDYPKTTSTFGDDSVLLVIDMQKCFAKNGTLPVPNADRIVSLINRLSKKFKNVVATQDWHPANSISFASTHAGHKPFDNVSVPYGKQTLWPDHCVMMSEDAAFHPKLNVNAQLIIRKGFISHTDSYSAFIEANGTHTGLRGYLQERRIHKIYVVGVAYQYCVAWSAVDAAKLGFKVYVIEDATKPIPIQDTIDSANADMQRHGVTRIKSRSLLK